MINFYSFLPTIPADFDLDKDGSYYNGDDVMPVTLIICIIRPITLSSIATLLQILAFIFVRLTSDYGHRTVKKGKGLDTSLLELAWLR